MKYPIFVIIGMILVVTVFFVSQQFIISEYNEKTKNASSNTNEKPIQPTDKIQITDGVKHNVT